MTWISVVLSEEEKKALRALAEMEYRTPRAQATLLIRHELERRGLLVENVNHENQGQKVQHEQ